MKIYQMYSIEKLAFNKIIIVHADFIFPLYQTVGGKLLWPTKLICELCQKIQNPTAEVCAFY